MNEREFCKPGSLVERHKPNPRVCRGEKGKGRLFSHTPSRFLPLSKASRPAYAAGLRSGSAVSVRLRRTRDCGLIEFSTPEETATSLSSGAVDPSSSRPLSPPMPFDGPLCAGRLEKGGGPVRGTVGRRFLDLERADEALRRLTGRAGVPVRAAGNKKKTPAQRLVPVRAVVVVHLTLHASWSLRRRR